MRRRGLVGAIQVSLLIAAVHSCEKSRQAKDERPKEDANASLVPLPEGDTTDGNATDGATTGGTTAGGETAGGSEGGGSTGEPDNSRFNLIVEPTQASIEANVLQPFCVPCHRGEGAPEKLDLTDLTPYVTHDHSHPPSYTRGLIRAGKPRESMLVIVMRSSSRDQMPTAGSGFPKVNEQQLQAIEQWIKELPGAGDGDEPGDDDGPGGDDEPGSDEPGDDAPGGDDEPGDGDQPGLDGEEP